MAGYRVHFTFYLLQVLATHSLRTPAYREAVPHAVTIKQPAAAQTIATGKASVRFVQAVLTPDLRSESGML